MTYVKEELPPMSSGPANNEINKFLKELENNLFDHDFLEQNLSEERKKRGGSSNRISIAGRK